MEAHCALKTKIHLLKKTEDVITITLTTDLGLMCVR